MGPEVSSAWWRASQKQHRMSFRVSRAGFRSAPRDALIASSVSDENKGRAFGLEGIGDNLGACLGPLLAVLLLLSFHFEIRWIFFVAIVPGLLAFLMIVLVHEQPVPVAAKSKIDV